MHGPRKKKSKEAHMNKRKTVKRGKKGKHLLEWEGIVNKMATPL